MKSSSKYCYEHNKQDSIKEGNKCLQHVFEVKYKNILWSQTHLRTKNRIIVEAEVDPQQFVGEIQPN